MSVNPSASYSFTVRLEIPRHAGAFAQIAAVIAAAGGLLGAIDLVEVEGGVSTRDVTISASDLDHAMAILAAVRAEEGYHVRAVSDRTFLIHRGGKIETGLRIPLNSRDDLSMAYTPGVARVCLAIAEDPAAAWNLTIKGNTVAVVSDGTAVLGLGDIGPEAAMPVMEGKAMLFKQFGGVDAFPICLATKDPDEIVGIVTALAPTFGGINLEDISAPRCFEIERRLQETLDIPVFHDDQHGTAVVVLAAFINALRVVGKEPADVKVVLAGAGAAGVACADMLLAYGVRDLIATDSKGIVVEGREGMDESKTALAARTNPRRVSGGIGAALDGADMFLGLARPGAVTLDEIRTMAPDAIVFSLANPTPEVQPEDIADRAAVIATGRSDYPNQINNVLAFPGIFRGALSVQARTINEPMQLAAAQAIADVVGDDLLADYIIPSVFNRRVAEVVAEAVATAAQESGVARRAAPSSPEEREAPIH